MAHIKWVSVSWEFWSSLLAGSIHHLKGWLGLEGVHPSCLPMWLTHGPLCWGWGVPMLGKGGASLGACLMPSNLIASPGLGAWDQGFCLLTHSCHSQSVSGNDLYQVEMFIDLSVQIQLLIIMIAWRQRAPLLSKSSPHGPVLCVRITDLTDVSWHCLSGAGAWGRAGGWAETAGPGCCLEEENGNRPEGPGGSNRGS